MTLFNRQLIFRIRIYFALPFATVKLPIKLFTRVIVVCLLKFKLELMVGLIIIQMTLLTRTIDKTIKRFFFYFFQNRKSESRRLCSLVIKSLFYWLDLIFNDFVFIIATKASLLRYNARRELLNLINVASKGENSFDRTF